MAAKFILMGLSSNRTIEDPTVQRSLLVAALIDEGYVVCRYRDGSGRGIKVSSPFQLNDDEFLHIWPGTVSEMPADICDELKGRLK